MKRSQPAVVANNHEEPSSKQQRTDEAVESYWTEFTNNMEAKFRKTPQLDLINNRLTHIANNVVAYDLNSCKEMIQKMKEFTMKLEQSMCEVEGFTIVNNITRQCFTYPYNLGIKMRDLKEKFHETGHAFSVDFKRSYIVPMAFDLDCKECKTKQNGTKCGDDVSASVALVISEHICRALQTKFPNNVRLIDCCTVFKARNSCNLHVYFGVSVSIILYHELVELLNSNLWCEVREKYKIDKVSTLGLPFSAKQDAEPYLPVTNLKSYEECIVSSSTPFFDTPTYIIRKQDYSVDKVIGSLKYTVARSKNSEWDDMDTCNKFLAIKLNYTLKCCQNVDYQIQTLKNTNAKFIAENNFNLEMYLNENNFDVRKYNVSTSQIDFEIENNINRIIHRELNNIGKKIAVLTYNVKNVVEEDMYSYLISFLIADDCGYTFYALSAICIFIVDIIKQEENADKVEAKNRVISFIRKIVQQTNTFQEKRLLFHVLKAIEDFDILTSIEAQTVKPSEWFAEISRQIKLKQLNGDVLSLLISTAMELNDDESVIELLVKYFKVSSSLLKPAVERPIYYYYLNGLYVECKETDLLNKSNLTSKQLFKNSKQLLLKLVELERITIEDKEKLNELMDTAWLKYISTARSSKVKFNMYDYFICTEHGVFNTLTGTYMKNISLLHFKTRKSYCTHPNQQYYSLNELNLSLLDKYTMYHHCLRTAIENQNALFYLAVVVPGLLLLEETLFNETLSTDIINIYCKKILHDDRNASNMYYMMPVILHYRFDLDSVMRVCRLLKLTIDRSGKPEISDMKNVYEKVLDSNISLLDVKKSRDIDYELEGSATNFINEMKNVYGAAFNAKLFSISYFICVFDYFSAESFLKSKLLVVASDKNMKRPPLSDSVSRDADFVLEPFKDDDFKAKSELNYKRAFKILFGDTYPTETTMNLLSSYSTIFEFDQRTVDDFFSFASMIYYPANLRKFLMLLIGSPKCGKTTVQHLLRDSNEPSTFGTDTVFGHITSGASPDLIQIYSTYLTNIIEVRRIDTETLKTLTGGDHVNKRGCHQNEFKELQPLSFAIGVANETPSMTNADEAIRERLAIFMMSNKYIDVSELDQYEDNPLLLYAGRITVKNKSMNIKDMAKEFSNLLYSQYVAKRNSQGVVIPKMTNSASKKATEDFLIKNNYVYDILNKSKIVFDADLHITIDDMQNAVADQISKFNDERPSNKKLNWEAFKRKVMVLFANYMLSDNVTFRGLGLVKVKSDAYADAKFQYSPGDKVKLIDLKRYLQNVCRLPSNSIKEVVTDYKLKYEFDEIENVFRDVRLV